MYKIIIFIFSICISNNTNAQSYIYDYEGTAYLLHGISCNEIVSLSDSSFCEAQETYGIGGEVFVKDVPYSVKIVESGYDVFINNKVHVVISKKSIKDSSNILIYRSNKLFVILKNFTLYSKEKGVWRKLYTISGETLDKCKRSKRVTVIDAFASPYEFTGKIKLED
jgi:hypothetical protein